MPSWLPSPSSRWKRGRSCGRGDHQDVADARQHQRGQRIVDHRLVVDRQQLLADARVIGYSRVPEPPASRIPLVVSLIRIIPSVFRQAGVQVTISGSFRSHRYRRHGRRGCLADHRLLILRCRVQLRKSGYGRPTDTCRSTRPLPIEHANPCRPPPFAVREPLSAPPSAERRPPSDAPSGLGHALPLPVRERPLGRFCGIAELTAVEKVGSSSSVAASKTGTAAAPIFAAVFRLPPSERAGQGR